LAGAAVCTFEIKMIIKIILEPKHEKVMAPFKINRLVLVFFKYQAPDVQTMTYPLASLSGDYIS
jgi:hypothetical protein